LSQSAVAYLIAWGGSFAALAAVRRPVRGLDSVVGASIVGLLIVFIGSSAAYALTTEGNAVGTVMAAAPFFAMGVMAVATARRRALGGDRRVSALQGVNEQGTLVLAAAISQWLGEVARHNELPQGCRAVVIGFFESSLGYEGYVCGTDNYDLDDSDWAVDARFRFEPMYFDAVSPARVSKSEYQYKVFEIVAALDREGSNHLLDSAPHLSVGFDDLSLENIR